MPKFKITTEAGPGTETPGEPIEFPHTDAATDDAQIALAEMARDKLPNGKRADFRVMVEDESGKQIYLAELHFAARTEVDLAREEEEAETAAKEVAFALAAGARGSSR